MTFGVAFATQEITVERHDDAGRSPAAVRIAWTQNYTDGDLPVFRSPAELIALYRDQGVTSDKRVHAY